MKSRSKERRGQCCVCSYFRRLIGEATDAASRRRVPTRVLWKDPTLHLVICVITWWLFCTLTFREILHGSPSERCYALKAGITYVHSHWQGWWSKALRPSAWLRPRPQDPPVRSRSTACRWAETCRRPGCEPPHGSGSGSCSGFAHWWQCCHPSFQKAVGGAQKEGSWSGNMSVKKRAACFD